MAHTVLTTSGRSARPRTPIEDGGLTRTGHHGMWRTQAEAVVLGATRAVNRPTTKPSKVSLRVPLRERPRVLLKCDMSPGQRLSGERERLVQRFEHPCRYGVVVTASCRMH